MKIVYLNILKSILICNLFCCFVAAAWMWGDRSDFIARYIFALIYSYVMFGISGSIIWCSFYLIISNYIKSKKVSHFLACGMASFMAAPVFYLSQGGIKAAIGSIFYIKLILPTATVCLIFYIFRYLKYEKFNKEGAPCSLFNE